MIPQVLSEIERVAALEVKMEAVLQAQVETNKKLDELTALRNKGWGIFWVASGILGTSFAAFFTQIASWLKH